MCELIIRIDEFSVKQVLPVQIKKNWAGKRCEAANRRSSRYLKNMQKFRSRFYFHASKILSFPTLTRFPLLKVKRGMGGVMGGPAATVLGQFNNELSAASGRVFLQHRKGRRMLTAYQRALDTCKRGRLDFHASSYFRLA